MIIDKVKIFISFFKINIIIFYSIFFQKKKIIFFFNPKNKLANITNYYIKDWLNSLQRKFNIIYAYAPNYNDKDAFKIYPILCKFIFGVDIFISTYVCDYFSNKSKRIYIHHDVYDTPLTKMSNYKELINKFKNYDLIFTPSKISTEMFEKLFKMSKKKPKIISIGYLKLDYLLKKKEEIKTKKSAVIIAPTDFNAFKKYSLISKLPELINFIIYKLNLKVIFRPHPSNREHKKIINIKKKFLYNQKFDFDISENYLNKYSKSFCMITDISGTAYTYAFLNESPVIFFSNNLIEQNFKYSNYIKDRVKIGYISKNTNEILKIIQKINKNKTKFRKSIKNLRLKLSNFGNVKKQMSKKINNITFKNEISI